MIELPKPILIVEAEPYISPKGSKVKKGIYRCFCGTEFTAFHSHVKNGSTKTCGCSTKQLLSENTKKHGYRYHPAYTVWKDMLARCKNPNNAWYSYYGGRGIDVCEEWKNNPENFCKWAESSGFSKKLQLDRRDNNKGYSPDNCRWVTSTVNNRNQRRLVKTNTSGYRGVSFSKTTNKWVAKITIDGRTKYIASKDTAVAAAYTYDAFVVANKLEHTTNFKIQNIEG